MRALVLRGRVVPPLARSAREGDDLPHRLLRDLRGDAGPHHPPTLPDRKPQLLLHRHRRDQLDRHRHVVPRHHHLHPCHHRLARLPKPHDLHLFPHLHHPPLPPPPHPRPPPPPRKHALAPHQKTLVDRPPPRPSTSGHPLPHRPYALTPPTPPPPLP